MPNVNQTIDPSLGDANIISDRDLISQPEITEILDKDDFDNKGYGILNPF